MAYVKIEPDSYVVGVFVEQPVFYHHDYHAKIRYRTPQRGTKERFMWNFAQTTGYGYDMKIYDGPLMFGQQIWNMIKLKGQDQEYRIDRTGLGPATRYAISHHAKADKERLKGLFYERLEFLLQEDEKQSIADMFDTSKMKEVPFPKGDATKGKND